MSIRQIRIGTRGSALALVQTGLVEQALRLQNPEIEIKRVVLQTEADRHKKKPIAEFGGDGVFVKELERALLAGEIDLAVHSAKDMPAKTCDGLCIAGVLKREDVRDVLVYRRELGESIDNISGRMMIGTGSPRRQCQLKALYPDFFCVGIRGNVPTRLDKLRRGEYDGVILAAAGLRRLGLMEQEDFCYHLFSEGEMLPAGGQAIIAIEGRVGDEVISLIQAISDESAFLELVIEQQVLRRLNAGCHEPIAVLAHVGGDEISLSAVRAFTLDHECGRVMVQPQALDNVACGMEAQALQNQNERTTIQTEEALLRRVCKNGAVSEWERLVNEVVEELAEG